MSYKPDIERAPAGSKIMAWLVYISSIVFATNPSETNLIGIPNYLMISLIKI